MPRTGDISKARGVVFVMQVAALVEQLEFQLGQRGQIIMVEGAIAEHQLPGDATCIGFRQALQVANDLCRRILIHFRAAATVFAGVVGGFIADDGEQSVGIRQAWIEASRQRFQLVRQLHLGADHPDDVRLLVIGALQDVAQHALGGGILQIGMEIQHQVDAALVGVADRSQGAAGIRGDAGGLLAAQIHPAQAIGDRPAP